MASTGESLVKKRVRLILDRNEEYYFFTPANGYGRTGVPDVVCCVDGRFLTIECKAGKNKPTALQEREMTLIRQHGGVALVVNEDNVHEVEEAVRNMKGTNQC